MARILGVEKHYVTVRDNISGTEIEFQYRMPTTSEREKYSNKSVQRVRNETVFKLAATRQQFGAAILTGIRDGDFQIEENGKVTALSSNPNSEGYRADWKEKVAESAPDLIQLLAAHVFEGSAEVVSKKDDDPEGDEKN